MNKQTTAMQELIEMAKTAKEHSKDGYVTYDEVIEAATELLTKEREQQDAWLKVLKASELMIMAFKTAPDDWLMTNDVMQAESVMIDAINECSNFTQIFKQD